MSPRFYFDEDAAHGDLIAALRQRGLDVRTAADEGLLSGSDEQQLDRAASLGRVLVSFNVADFHRLHGVFTASGQHHAGMLLLRQADRLSVGERLRRLLRFATERTAEDLADSVTFLGALQIRRPWDAAGRPGERIPQRSTFFHPKLGTGLVFHPLYG